MRVLSQLLLLCLVFIILVFGVSISEAAKKKSGRSDASRYHDCDSCVAAGFGWSWEEEECGTYVNTDCSPPTSSTRDTDRRATEAETSSSNYESDIATDRESPSSHPAHNNDDDDDDYIADDDMADDDDSDSYTRTPKTFSWADTEATTHIWRIINAGDYASLSQLLDRDPDVVKYRSADGRGALWWAYEYGHEAIADLLIANGADEEAEDKHGNKPRDLRARDL